MTASLGLDARHKRNPVHASRCLTDGQSWPCDAAQFAAALEVAQADNKRLREDAEKWRAAEAEGHIVTFSETGYGLQHPPSCRPDLIGCAFNLYLADLDGPDRPPGRYRLSWGAEEEDGEMLPVYDALAANRAAGAEADEARRRRWHEMDSDHDQPFEACASAICQGTMPVPR